MTLKQWAQCWKNASKVLSEVRAQDIRSTNTAEAIRCFNQIFLSTIQKQEPKPTSGLVEFQSALRKLRP